jgi:hypothetical protein
VIVGSTVDTGGMRNSLFRINHPRMLSKYYKTQFFRFPRLRNYDIIVWIDMNKAIGDHDCLEYLVSIFKSRPDKNIIAVNHPDLSRKCLLSQEVDACSKILPGLRSRKTVQGIRVPFQDVRRQYTHYLASGYREDYWKSENLSYRNHRCIGLWETSLIAFRMKTSAIEKFLDRWFHEMLVWTFRDQISLPYVIQMLNEVPYTIPDAIRSFFPRIIRYKHGR